MSDARFKRLFAGTEELPLFTDLESEDGGWAPDKTFPKFSRFMENATNSIKEEEGARMLDYADSDKVRSEDTPDLIKSLMPDQVRRYEALKRYKENKDASIDRNDIDLEIVKAILEKNDPTLANNLKYTRNQNGPFFDPFYDEQIKRLSANVSQRDVESIPEFNTERYMDGSYGSYNPKTGEIKLDKNLREGNSVITGTATLLHEANHKEHPTKYKTDESMPNFSKTNYPVKSAIDNNSVTKWNTYLHNKTVAPRTEDEILRTAKNPSPSLANLSSVGQQYNLFEDALKHNPEEQISKMSDEQKELSRFEQLKKLLGGN